MSSPVPIPDEWAARIRAYPAEGGPSGADWLPTVPRRIAQALQHWGLAVDGGPATGWTAIVVPVRRDEERLALKVTWPHTEGTHEHLALRCWGGTGAVRLVAALPGDGLLLLERLDAATDLRTLPVEDAARIIGELLGRLGVPAPEAFPGLAAYLHPHVERMAGRAAVPRRIADRTAGLLRELTAEPLPNTLLHTDLHFENVLRGRGQWLAIDPKPVRGHPGFELVPVLMNRREEWGGRGFRSAMRRRLELTAEAAGIDIDEAFAWSLLRAGLEVSWASALEDREDLTFFIALTKALDE